MELSERFPRLQSVGLISLSPLDRYEVISSPAGPVECVCYYDRKDFENAIIALAYKLEPRPIPASMGAMFLSGLVDHVAMEKVSIILLSRGPYSAIPAKAVGLDEEEWLDRSYDIRRHHETAHFIQRKLFPENKHPLKDEVKADMVGLMKAFGRYDPSMARLFLGIEGDRYRPGGRLEIYEHEGKTDDEFMQEANAYLNRIAEYVSGRTEDAYTLLMELEEKKI